MNVGVIGYGIMAKGMVHNLSSKGFFVLLSNRTAPKELPDTVTFVGAPRNAAANIVVLCVADDAALEQVVFGEDGILAALEPGAILIDSSTTSVAMTERMAAACAERSLKFIDAPVTGSKAGAEAGTLVYMLGGEGAAIDAAMPVLQAMGRKFVHCGPATFGARAKIALNLTQAMLLEASLEGLALGMKEGIPLDKLWEIFEHSGAHVNVTSYIMPLLRARNFGPNFRLALMHKDLTLAEQELVRLGLDLPLALRIREIYAAALERGDEDFFTIAKELERKTGVAFR